MPVARLYTKSQWDAFAHTLDALPCGLRCWLGDFEQQVAPPYLPASLWQQNATLPGRSGNAPLPGRLHGRWRGTIKGCVRGTLSGLWSV